MNRGQVLEVTVLVRASFLTSGLTLLRTSLMAWNVINLQMSKEPPLSRIAADISIKRTLFCSMHSHTYPHTQTHTHTHTHTRSNLLLKCLSRMVCTHYLTPSAWLLLVHSPDKEEERDNRRRATKSECNVPHRGRLGLNFRSWWDAAAKAGLLTSSGLLLLLLLLLLCLLWDGDSGGELLLRCLLPASGSLAQPLSLSYLPRTLLPLLFLLLPFSITCSLLSLVSPPPPRSPNSRLTKERESCTIGFYTRSACCFCFKCEHKVIV